jgi:serine protease AprX
MHSSSRYAWPLLFSFALALLMPCAEAALIDPGLEQQIATHEGPHEVIVTFRDPSQVTSLNEKLGVEIIALQTLPMAGAILSEAQIDEISQWESVKSIYYNAPLQYFNYTSGEITGGHYVHDNLGYKGDGVTVAVLDSGTDATHPDLAYGSTTIQNVKIVGDLDLAGGLTVFLEGQLNTDTTSGHGTHVSGTVAGTGEVSANDERRAFYHAGIAPAASLVGLGAGEGISILYALLGFDYAIANRERFGIDVITNSWGGGDGASFDPNNPINQASYEAYRRGMIVLFAASNSGPGEDTLNQYAIAPWVINVAAGTPEKKLADFSSRGVEGHFYKHPDIVAPGQGITSTRAPNTAIGALGPVVDENHPEYYLYYHTISGTSMATPFVAGTVALLLQANPQLSPDQVEEILMDTAEPMTAYAFHEVGAGHIDVRAAVERAEITSGERQQFLAGNTLWASNGTWSEIDSASELVQYSGKWKAQDDNDAIGGSYMKVRTNKHGASAFLRFKGPALQISHPVDVQGGIADVYVDGVHYRRASFHGATKEFGHAISINGLGDSEHLVELRAVDGNVYLDAFLVDGQAFSPNVTFVTEETIHTGQIGPSAENLQVDEIPFEVGADVITIGAELGWDGLADLDLYLVDPNGNQVASGATLANPEQLEFDVAIPGTYTWRITGYISVLTDYTLRQRLTRALGNDE